ncbi:DUF3450 domain-containing protein [Pseudohongiella sp. SYSU M77423]|uniref:DUF3450 domain-containing protein n=1 Tax=unclassified Pseudohongiella TaxID=2629611 RepID=UPI000C4F4828|nr:MULTISPECIES: DUF3450 domain-containing protein [unclassified Pseudohongiella]MAY56489.1 hypothetical protein [Gammaproteobacteria bacterium]MEC8860113.1 DUF3450 domain-containing protein [Pseudomonadota bacterium]HBN14920.1 hypothetical protein [Pseudohongiella sp.]MBJ54602.1 hypothetical protein [Gammaproteobacteria bacterium]MDH7943159.1 DUF3450 domain-containing protein [Pseudohongiella sp. SYSU M77423]|tara:strand:+ start:5388 stop:6170 length:783 start_codon:yes stop_codon:yes gene_type:complete
MKNRRLYSKVLAPLASLLVIGTALAQDVDTSAIEQAQSVVGETNREAAESQERINRLSNSSSSLFEEFKTESDNLEALLVLNANWRRQIAIQEDQLETISESIAEVRNVTQELPLLMSRMIASIEQFIELDIPFHLEQRRARIQFVRDAIDDPNVSTAERFRQILVLYQTENAYGRTHETYSATLNLDGVPTDVDMLRVGRIALTYQTKDRTRTGAWDSESRQWVTLEDGAYRNAIRDAINVSSGLIAPEIFELPIVAPE